MGDYNSPLYKDITHVLLSLSYCIVGCFCPLVEPSTPYDNQSQNANLWGAKMMTIFCNDANRLISSSVARTGFFSGRFLLPDLTLICISPNKGSPWTTWKLLRYPL